MHRQGMEMFGWKLPLIVDTETLPPLKVPSQGTCTWHDRQTDEVLFTAEWRLREEFGKLVFWLFYQVPLGHGWKAVHEERLRLIYHGHEVTGFYCPGKDHYSKISRVTDRVFLTPFGIHCPRCYRGEAYSVSLFNDKVV
jgi:hypothetical protein